VLQLASNTAAAKIAIAIICLLPVCRCAGIRNEISGEDEVFASGSGLYPSREAIQMWPALVRLNKIRLTPIFNYSS
jgi:hypothetical protein